VSGAVSVVTKEKGAGEYRRSLSEQGGGSAVMWNSRRDRGRSRGSKKIGGRKQFSEGTCGQKKYACAQLPKKAATKRSRNRGKKRGAAKTLAEGKKKRIRKIGGMDSAGGRRGRLKDYRLKRTKALERMKTI